MSLSGPTAAATVRSESPYRQLILEAVPRLLGQLDRETLSPTRGSFDRDHWSWKFRDFPVILLQAGLIPLAWLHTHDLEGNGYRDNDELLQWIASGIDSILERQHRNGAFDTVGPNTMDHGITLSMVYALATVDRALGDRLDATQRARVAESITRGCRFAARTAEDYAFISNHHAMFALAWHRAGLLTGDASLIARADDTIEQIIAHQSAEGWYLEYGGADPGYESLGIHYLGLFNRERPLADLEASLVRAVEFYTHTVAADGSVGGGYGSRDTLLWYPGGFELLAHKVPAAASIARFMRDRLFVGNVVTPRTVDAHNLPTLMASYGTALEAHPTDPQVPRRPLPCQGPQPLRVFSESGLAMIGTPHYRAVANLRQGGALVVFEAGSGRILHEDAGYVIQAAGRDWTTALLNQPVRVAQTERQLQVTSTFLRANREVLTPLKFLVLRTLNLTAFRSVRLGAFIRNRIVSQIITGRTSGPYSISRRIDFGDEEVSVHDDLSAGGGPPVTGVFRPRTYQAQHMGSARYFHPRELVSMATALREAPATLAARFRQGGRLALQFVVSAAVRPRAGGPPASVAHVSAVPELTE